MTAGTSPRTRGRAAHAPAAGCGHNRPSIPNWGSYTSTRETRRSDKDGCAGRRDLADAAVSVHRQGRTDAALLPDLSGDLEPGARETRASDVFPVLDEGVVHPLARRLEFRLALLQPQDATV